jgi:hypothetical protein
MSNIDVNQVLDEWVSSIDTSNAMAMTADIARRSSPEYRSAEAFCAREVSTADAQNDLFTHKSDPFLFRKWVSLMREQAPEDIRTYQGPRKDEIMADYLGKKVMSLLCLDHGSYAHNFQVWSGSEDSMTYTSVVSHHGPCSHWHGHIGYCWEGTYVNDRTDAC